MLGVVYQYLDGIFVFCIIRWAPLCENSVIDICNFSLLVQFIDGDRVVVAISTLAETDTSAALLTRFSLITYVGVVNIESLFRHNVDMYDVL